MSDDLRETLSRLHAQLSDADNLDTELADRLRTAAADVQTALDNQDLSSDNHEVHVDRLTELAQHFEQSHPTLSGTITRLIDILGQAGI